MTLVLQGKTILNAARTTLCDIPERNARVCPQAIAIQFENRLHTHAQYLDRINRLAAGLIVYSKKNLASYKCPKRTEFVDALPRLNTGMINKVDMRERYTNAPISNREG